MARFWGDVARGFGPAYAASTARTDRRKAAELAQANLKASIERQDKLYAAMQAQKQEDIRAQAMGFTPETLAQAIEETGARETGYKAGLPPESAAQAQKGLTREQLIAITSRSTGINLIFMGLGRKKGRKRRKQEKKNQNLKNWQHKQRLQPIKQQQQH